ncbi:exosome complex component RRP45 [Aricia agestis]|uniref:exosome complex component RRP45 n=1 Tax=Aricia agestis TaxID=91739 RepID=UPI001C20BD1C|nr:exosome complex component RRP45 [Aricia agestis]
MRDIILSNCEKSFIQKIISQGHRLDGRNFNDSRNLEISFGSDFGSCITTLGETKVLAQVTCEVVQPKQIRPNEGILYLNVEISPMAAPQFEANRQTDLTVYLNRLLEKCFKDSKCIDLEALCIVVEEKVWSLRVDVKVLNHDGNLVECASIATLASLAHFKRPDVTRSGENVTIHTLAERDPIPTVLYHYPVCVSFAIFNNDMLISDPNFIEESVCISSTDESNSGGVLVVGMNQYREICLLDLTGAAVYNSKIVHKAVQNAAERSKTVVELVKRVIIDDDNKRQKRVKINFSDIITDSHIQSLNRKDLSICLKNYHVDDAVADNDVKMDEDDVEPEPSKYDVIPSLPHTAELKSNTGTTSWIEISSESEEEK